MTGSLIAARIRGSRGGRGSKDAPADAERRRLAGRSFNARSSTAPEDEVAVGAACDRPLEDRAIAHGPMRRPRPAGDAAVRRSAAAAQRRTARARSRGEVFDRRLAVDPGEEQGRQQRRRARFEAVGGLPVDASEIGAANAEKATPYRARSAPCARALQQEMVETERKVEGGIAEPRAFGVEEHRSVRPDKDVLRADVAMNQRTLGRRVVRASASNCGASSACARPVARR